MTVTTEQLLSFLGIDEASLDIYLGGRYAVIQRDPQPDEENIAVDTLIAFMIVDLEGEPASVGGGGFGHEPWGHFPFGHETSIAGTLDFDVYVEGTLVLQYIGGVQTWTGGFTGSVVDSTPSDPYFFHRVSMVPPSAYVSLQEVTVRVVVNPSAPWLDINYTFTIQDLTPPSVVSLTAIDEKIAQIIFDDRMCTEGAGSALRPEAYTVVTQNVPPYPGVSLDVVGVHEVAGYGGRRFNLHFQWEMTPGCQYQVTVDPSVTDYAGNGIA